MESVYVILATTPSAMDAHWMGSVKDVSLCTSFTFTRRSPKEELKTRTSSWSELPRIVKNTKPTMCSQVLTLELNHDSLPTIPLFPPGRMVATPGALALLKQNQQVTPGITVETSARRLG